MEDIQALHRYLAGCTQALEHKINPPSGPPWFKIRIQIWDKDQYAKLIWGSGVRMTRQVYTFVSTEPGSVNLA